MREKDLEHHLRGEGEKAAPEKTLEKPPDKSKKKEEAVGSEIQEDPPLARALELLKTWRILHKGPQKKVS
jgi:hypothetical protein